MLDPGKNTPGSSRSPSKGSWLRHLNSKERSALLAACAGYGVDSFDYLVLPLVTPVLQSQWGSSNREVGMIATSTLVSSAIGGWGAGILADRYGRVRILNLTIIVFAIFTFACGFTQAPYQLLLARTLQGIGFGGEWAVGSMLVTETIRSEYRGRAAGFVQSSWAIGWAAAVLVWVALSRWLPQELAWRVMFSLGVLPALLVLLIRRTVPEPELYTRTRAVVMSGARRANFLDIFKPPVLRGTVLASLMLTGMQGAYYAIAQWLPKFLKEERHLTVLDSGGYQASVIGGAFVGYLTGAYLTDRIGRRQAFVLFALGAGSLVFAYMSLPISNAEMLALGFPLGFFMSGIFSGTGAYLSELFSNEIRGSGQAFCYNFGRGIGAIFPFMVGVLSDQTLSLATAIGVCAGSAYALVVLAAVLLPDRGRDLHRD